MTIPEAMHWASEEYNDEVLRARADTNLQARLNASMIREYIEIDRGLPNYVSEIAGAMKAGKPGERLPDYVYQMARMCFRFGMRVQRKLDRPDEGTSSFWRPRQDD